MKQNYKTKYFLKQVLDLAYCAKKSGRDFIFLKTENLTIPFSLYQLREMSKDCEALSLKKEGGFYDEESKCLLANQYYYDFDLLRKLYKDNNSKLRNLRKEAENKEIKCKKEKQLLSEPDIYSKYKCAYKINSRQEVIDFIENKRYPNIFKSMKEDICVANTFLDEPRKLRYNIKITLNKDNCLQKIGIRCTNNYVSAKKINDNNEKFHGSFKEDILKMYNLKEFDNSDVASSIPRLTACLNGKKWNEIEDYYKEILKVCMLLIDIRNKEYNVIEVYKRYTLVSNFTINNNYKLFNSITSYFEKTEKKNNIFRNMIKPLILPCYFDNSPKNASSHMNRKGPNDKKEVYEAVCFYKRWCKSFNIDFRYFIEQLWIALRVVCGKTYDSKIFLIESAAYAKVARKAVELGYHNILQIYDALYTEVKCKELDKIYEESVYEIIKLYNKDIENYKVNSISNRYTLVSNYHTNNNYKLLSSTNQINRTRDESKGRKKRQMTEQTKNILIDKEAGMTNKVIAEKYGLTAGRVSQIIKANK
jgi:hypothetical protein